MTAPVLPESAIRAHTDHGGYSRGLAYARDGMVVSADWDADTQVLTGIVRGSGGARYRCRVAVGFAPGLGVSLRSVCSCPVGSACKHVVAALLVNRERMHIAPAAKPARGSTAGSQPAPARAEPEAIAPARSGWRTVLSAPSASSADAPLALGVELRRRPPQARNRWRSEPPERAEPRALVHDPGEVFLAVRPLMRSSSTGRWIQGDADWDAIRRSPLRFREEQIRWFADFLSIARDSLLSGTATAWIVLDRVESPLLFEHLHRAARAGIPLVATAKDTVVRLRERAAARLRIDAAGDALRLSAGISFEDERTSKGEPDAEGIRRIGRSGAYRWEVRNTRITVTLGAAPLSPDVAALIDAGGVKVPAGERADFFAEAYPRLARRNELDTGAGVELPAPVTPEPVLTVRFSAGDVLAYRFDWEYTGIGRFPFGAVHDPRRDAQAEEEARAALEAQWSALTRTPLPDAAELRGIEAAEFAAQVLPALEESGLRVVVTGRRKQYHELAGDPEIRVWTVEFTDPDWFDLGVLVTIDGRTVPFGPLFTALSMRRTKLLLIDGSYLSLAHPALQRLRELLDEAAELAEWETGPRISRHQIALWEEFEDLADEAEPAVSWRAAVEGLRGVERVPETPTPAGLRARLRPYQKAGFDWLAFLWRHRLGGVLADDMGLGKTLQLLAFSQHLRETGERRPILVVAPTSVLGTWEEEAERFAPGLRVTTIDGTSAARGRTVADAVAGADLVVTSYTLVRLDEEEFAAVEWAAVILDEAQFVKNPVTRQHRAVAALRADATFAASGTPMENSLGELWALLQLTAPGLFPSARRFRQEYIQPIEQGKVPENEEGGDYRQRRLERLRRRIRPLLLRRTKELVAGDLPAKQEQLLHIDLSPAHRALYDTVLQRERQKVLGLLEDLDRNRFIVFRSLTMLRLLSLAPGLIDAEDAKLGSRKLDVLVERMAELQTEGHRALVFSQFTTFLRLAAERLESAGIPYAYLDGSTTRRRSVIEEFRTGEQPVFLISLKAGGFGLTLTEADYVFLLDPWWNPAAEAQAVDRTHRIGQEKQVFVYRMISAGTIEEKVLALQQRKARLFTAVMDDDALFAQSLTADDIRALFET